MYLLNKSTKLINELFDNYVSNYLTSYGSPYLTSISSNKVTLKGDRGGQRGNIAPIPARQKKLSYRRETARQLRVFIYAG